MNIESYIITFFPALIRSIKKFILRICEWLFAITMIFIKCHDNFFYLKTFKKKIKNYQVCHDILLKSWLLQNAIHVCKQLCIYGWRQQWDTSTKINFNGYFFVSEYPLSMH